MKASELRLGNYVFDSDGKAKQIHETATYPKEYRFEDVVKIEGVCLLISEIEPIPLTEEWLLNLGFIKMDEKHNFFILGINPNLKIDKSLKWVAWCNTVLNNIKFDYIHQLQNLYFALTGEELTIKQL